MKSIRVALVAAALALAGLLAVGTSAAVGETPGLESVEETIGRHATAFAPVSAADAAEVIRLAAGSTELARARAWLAPLHIEIDEPRLVGTRFGWVGVHYPINSPLLPEAGQYALWFDTATLAVVAEAAFVPSRDAIRVRMVLAGETVLDDVIPLARLDGDRFWECLRTCTKGALSHWLYTLVRAACSRVCVPVGIYCAPCVIALSALEAGMISGCVFACSQQVPESGAWAMPPGGARSTTVPDSGYPLPVWR